jgi:hypothetical protein
MAHFAQLDKNNLVTQVIVLSNAVVGESYPESESVGVSFIANDLKLLGTWKQTSYNGNFRKQYAGIGYEYNEINDVFIAQKPYPSWTLDENFDWIAPVPLPDSEGSYTWNEENQQWEQIDSE